MPFTAHDVTTAVLIRGLTNLKTVLQRAEGHAAANSIPAGDLLRARLADDMNNLTVQVHWAAEGAKRGVDQLMGRAAPPAMPREAASFAELYAQLDDAIAHLAAVAPADLAAGLARSIDVPRRGGVSTLTATRYVLEFLLPNFYFHSTTAYAILRAAGVPLTKAEIIGELR